MSRTSADHLQQTLWDMQRRFGQGVVTTGDRLASGNRIPTGFTAVDAQLEGGGIALGQMSAVVGQPTSGATTLVYHLIASAQQGDRIAVYVDISGTFDAEYAVSCGVMLDRLLIINTSNPGRGLNMALDAVRSEKAALVALDWTTRRMDNKYLDRLRANVARTRTALVMLMHNLQSPDLMHTALILRRQDWLTQGDEVSGYHVRVKVLRDGGTERDKSADIDITPKAFAS